MLPSGGYPQRGILDLIFWFKRNTIFVLAVCVSLLWQLKPTDFYFSRLCCKTPFSTFPRHAGTFATFM